MVSTTTQAIYDHFIPCGQLPGEASSHYLAREGTIFAGKTLGWGSLGIATVTILTHTPIGSLLTITGIALIALTVNYTDGSKSFKELAGALSGFTATMGGLSLTLVNLWEKGKLTLTATSIALSVLGCLMANIERGVATVVLPDVSEANLEKVQCSGRKIEKLRFESYSPLSAAGLAVLSKIKPDQIIFSNERMEMAELKIFNQFLNTPLRNSLLFYYYDQDNFLRKVTTSDFHSLWLAHQSKPDLPLLNQYLITLSALNIQNGISLNLNSAWTVEDIQEIFKLVHPKTLHFNDKKIDESVLSFLQSKYVMEEVAYYSHSFKLIYNEDVLIKGETSEALIDQLKNQKQNLRKVTVLAPQSPIRLEKPFLKRLIELAPMEIVFVNCLMDEKSYSEMITHYRRLNHYLNQYKYAISFENDKIVLRKVLKLIESKKIEFRLVDQAGFDSMILISESNRIDKLIVAKEILDNPALRNQLFLALPLVKPKEVVIPCAKTAEELKQKMAA